METGGDWSSIRILGDGYHRWGWGSGANLNTAKLTTFQHSYLYKRVVQAKMLIDTNFGDKLDLARIAGEASFSKYHFFRLFKEMYGKTPLSHLTAIRMEESKKLLSQSLTIAEIAYRVGYESTTAFSAMFKKHVRVSPSDFRARVERERANKAANPLRFVPNCFAESRGWVKNSKIE